MYKLYHGDCLEELHKVDDNSIDCIITDPPYEININQKWDHIIPLEPMWNHLKRIIKKNRAIVLFGRNPFSSDLIQSNKERYKYQWTWVKNSPFDIFNAKLKPMSITEDILVFSNGTTANGSKNNMLYNPQGLVVHNKILDGRRGGKCKYKAARTSHKENHLQEFTNYPNNVLFYDKVQKGIHPTEKPIDLLEYLIKTYTSEGDTILDFTFGSCSCGEACLNTNRNFIGIEKDDYYYNEGIKRLQRIEKTINNQKSKQENLRNFFNDN